MNPMNTKIMLDLETLGTAPGSVILSIGAVKFDRHGLRPNPFYARIDPQSCIDAGLVMDVSTVVWWMKQSDEARAEFVLGEKTRIREALQGFSIWANYDPVAPEIELWGNGAAFDNTLLAAAYAAVRLPMPWKFWNDRCYRTVKALHPDLPMVKRSGTHHNALDDARSQAEHLITLPSFQAMCALEAQPSPTP